MRWSVALVVLALAGVVAACGASEDFSSGAGSAQKVIAPRSAAERRFVARVKPICARAVRRFDRVPVPADLSERAASSRSTARIFASLRRSLDRVPAPPVYRSVLDAMTREMRNGQSLQGKVARAAERGDRDSVTTFVQLSDRVAGNLARWGRGVLGIDRCEPRPEG